MKTTLKLLALIALTTSLPAPATDLVWTNLIGGNWNTAANWSPNTVPGVADTAVITNGGTYTVTLNVSPSLSGLLLGGTTGTQTLAMPSGSLTITTNGFIGPNGVLRLYSTATKSLYGALTNAGTIVWADTGAINFFGIFHNTAGGVFDAQASSTMNYFSGSSAFINDGTFRKSGGTGNTDLEPPFINNGTVDAQTGTIRFTSQPKTLNPGCRFIGAGTNQLLSGTFTLAGAFSSSNLLWSGGTLAGAGTLSGTMQWGSGTLGAGAALTVAADGQLTLVGVTARTLTGALTNAGVVLWQDTGLIYHYGIIHNLAGARFEARNDAALDYTSGSPVFINEGTFRKSAGTGLTDVQTGFVNHGTVDAQTGTIRFINQPKTFNDGCRFIGAGTNLLAGGTLTLAGAITSSNLLWTGGTLAGVGSVSGTMQWGAGTLGAGAALTVTANSLLTLVGTTTRTLTGALTNAGVVLWQDTASIYHYGTIHNLAGGRFEVRNDVALNHISGAPVFINDGTFRKVASNGTTDLEPAFINNGTVDAQTGTIRFLTKDKTFNDGCRFTGAGTNLLAGGTATLAGTVTSDNLTLSGATLAGTGTVAGSFFWYLGTLSSTVSFNVSPGSLLLLASSGIKTLNGSVTNAGTVRWTGSGDIYLFGVIHNLVGGLFEAQNNEPIRHISGTPVIINDGTFRKLASAGTTDLEPRFINNGTVDAQTGTFRFLSQPKTFNDGCRFTGAGTNLLAGGSVTLAGGIASENLALNGSTVTGSGSVTGSFFWYLGTLTSDVSFNVPTNGLVLLASSGIKTLNGTITNAGTVRWTGTGSIYLFGALHNQPTGLFDAANDEVLNLISGSPVFINEGIFRKSAGTNVTTCEIPLTNRGRIEVNTGTLRFTGATYTHAGGTIQLAGGRFYSGRPLNLTTGQLTGWGTCDISVTNAATVTAAGTGTLAITGHYDQTLNGNVEFELSGTSPGTNHSRLNVLGNARVNGSISVRRAGGYLPSPGDGFAVLAAPAVSGTFKCFNGFFFLGENRRLSVAYNPADVTLTAVNAPDPAAFLSIARDAQVIVCWPWEFPGFSLLANTNLNTTNWTVIPGVTNRYLETPMAPEKYFRLWQP